MIVSSLSITLTSAIAVDPLLKGRLSEMTLPQSAPEIMRRARCNTSLTQSHKVSAHVQGFASRCSQSGSQGIETEKLSQCSFTVVVAKIDPLCCLLSASTSYR